MMQRATYETASPPTGRVLDVLELLAQRDRDGPRLTDVIEELGITRATAHSILTTLCDRGWASRDPTDKTFSIGTELGIAAARAESARPLAQATRHAASSLATNVRDSTSVTERVGDSLVITVFEPGADQPTLSRPGDRVPFAAPFGPAFAAWEQEADRRAWRERSGVTNVTVAERLEEQLAVTRDRGYSVERLTPAVARTAQLIGTLRGESLPMTLRQIIDEVLVEITTVGSLPDEAPDGKPYPVTALSAPVFDHHGRVVLNLAIHPFRPLTAKQIEARGRRLTSTTSAISMMDPQEEPHR